MEAVTRARVSPSSQHIPELLFLIEQLAEGPKCGCGGGGGGRNNTSVGGPVIYSEVAQPL